MRDIGKHPDSGNPIENEHEYEVITGYGLVCPWCKESIDPGYDLEDLFDLALNEDHEHDILCQNCGATLDIFYRFIELAAPYTAMAKVEVEATKRIA